MGPDLNIPDEGLLGGNQRGKGRKGKRSFMDDETLKVRLDRRALALDQDRQTWRANWVDLANNFLPFRGRWLADASDTNKGWRRNYAIVNETPLLAIRTLGSGLLAGVTSPSRPWLRLSVPAEFMNEPGVKQWLYEHSEKMLDIFAKSNLYNSLVMCYQEFGVFGTLALIVDEDDETVINTQSFTIGSYYIGQNKRRKVDVFYRDYEWTVRQVVERFVTGPIEDDASWANISLKTRALWDQRQYETFIKIRHCIEPNTDRMIARNGKFASDAAGMAFRSVYYERGGDPDRILEDSGKVLRNGGYRENPVLVARWQTNSEDVWGRGPAMDALGSARELQYQEKQLRLAIEKLVSPPMRADPRLRNQRTSLLAGDVTYVDQEQGKVGFEPVYEIRPDVSALRENIQRLEQRINALCYQEIFQLFISERPDEGKQPVTAEQIAAEKEEKLLMLGPVLEQLNDELLNPLVRRTWGIMRRRGLVAPPPPALQGAEITVEYISILHQAQRAVSTGTIEQAVNFVARIAEIQAQAAEAHPEILDMVDLDKTVEEYFDKLGAPPMMLRDEDQVAEIRQQRAQAAQQQAQAAQAQQAAEAAPKVAQAASHLGNTPVNGGQSTALDTLLQSIGAGR